MDTPAPEETEAPPPGEDGVDPVDGLPVLNVLVPMRRYQLTVRHVLLAKLGGISHFILSVLDGEGGSLQTFVEISGLSPEQYGPLLQRLEALALVQDGALTDAGHRMAHILREVHERTAIVWLDAWDRGTPLMVLGDDVARPVTDEDEKSCWARARHNKDLVADGNHQRMRLQSHFPKYLHDAFPQSAAIPGAMETRWGTEWEITLRSDVDGALVVPVKRSDAGGERDFAVAVASPVSVLETSWSAPEALPPELTPETPAPIRRCFRHADGQMSEPEGLLTAIDTDPGRKPMPCWPSVSDEEKKRVAGLLFQQMAEEMEAESPLLDRLHSLTTAWEVLRFSWDVVRARCCEDSRVICTKA